MNVCHVTSVHRPFDTRIFHRECTSVAQAGHNVTLIAPCDLDEGIIDGIHLIPLPEVDRRYERPRLWRQIVRTVRDLRPDIVHFHDPELLSVCRFLRPAKLVYDCHEPYAETVLLRDWLPRPARYPLSRLVSLLEPILARQASAIIVTEESHAIPFSRGRQPVELIYNFPCLRDFGLSHCSDGKTIVHVGVNSEPRGCTTIVEAAKLVIEHMPEARFLLLGDYDPPSYEEEIQALVLAYGLEENVFVLGRVVFSEVPQWLTKADIGLVPWHGLEHFPTRVIPTKLFEYMSSRLAVVASDLPTTRRFMDGLECGLLVEPADPQALASSIEYLLRHPGKAREMGENGRRAVEESYHWAAESEKLLRLYGQLVQTQSPCVELEA